MVRTSIATRCVIESLERRALCATSGIDLSFGRGGWTVGPAGTDWIEDLVVQPDGKFITASSGLMPGPWRGSDFTLTRYNPDGSLDPTFGTNGIVWTDFFGQGERLHTIKLLPDGKILAAGEASTIPNTSAGYEVAVVRYNADGSLDTTFGDEGRFHMPVANVTYIHQMDVLPDGAMVLVGAIQTANWSFDTIVVRVIADGYADETFGQGGVMQLNRFHGDEGVAVSAQPDGKFLVVADGGQTAHAFDLMRFNSDGSFDTTFGTGGSVVVTAVAAPDAIYPVYFAGWRANLLVQPDGKILLSDSLNDGKRSYFTLFRFNADGSADTTFNGTGRSDRLYGTSSSGTDIALQPDGKIVQSGGIDENFAVIRYNPDGSLDSTFGVNGVAGVSLGGKYDTSFGFADTVAIGPSGEIYLAGKRAGYARGALVKFANDPMYSVSTDGAFVVRGSDGPDTITLSRNGSGYLSINRNGAVRQFALPLGVVVQVDAGGGDDYVQAYAGTGPLRISGGDGNDTLIGSEYADSINGNAGKDKIAGGYGDDRLAGNGGNDAIVGDVGRDRIYGDAGNDKAEAGPGSDRVWGGDGNDILGGGAGNDVLYGDGGANTVTGGDGEDRIITWTETDLLVIGGPSKKLVDPNTGLITLVEGLL